MNQSLKPSQLSKVTIKGFKSIKECELELKNINILIGCNGAGKSNFIGFFRMIQQIVEKNLQLFVAKQGGPDVFLHFGRKHTSQLAGELFFGDNAYKFSLEPTADNKMVFVREASHWKKHGDWKPVAGHFESRIDAEQGAIAEYVYKAMKSWRVYHFHDTGENSPIKQSQSINDNEYFRPDGQNLAAYLYLLKSKHRNIYHWIVKTVQLVAPFFGDFHLRPTPHNKDFIELEWTEKGQDIPFKAHHLSDGTLRFICLATLFLLPEERQPDTILVDEPELGLHPYAISVLSSLVKSTATAKQVVVSTQSVELLNEFLAEDIIVVDRNGGLSELRRLKKDELGEWLDEYSLGNLWKKNILGARP